MAKRIRGGRRAGPRRRRVRMRRVPVKVAGKTVFHIKLPEVRS